MDASLAQRAAAASDGAAALRMLRRTCAALLACCWMLLAPAVAQTQPPTDQQLGEWISNYYIHKDAGKVASFLASVQESQLLERRNGAISPFIAFLTVVFSDNQAQVRAWSSNAKATGQMRQAIQFALWLSGNGSMIADVFKESPDFASRRPGNMMDARLRHAGDIDMMWGAFSASGNAGYARRVIDALDESIPLSGEAAMDTLTRRAAEWSLVNNMAQHELVDRMLRKEAASRPSGAVRAKLEEIIARNDRQRKPLPDQDGEFSAMLVITDEAALAEYDKPSSEGMRFTLATKARVGDTIAIKLVFAGMQLTDDLNADVTFDIKAIEPDGTVKEVGANLEAFRGKVPTRFKIFDNRAFLKVKFDPGDRAGTYKFVAQIRDNVGGRKVDLAREIDLVP
jgi:hypothetical protein